VIRYLIESQLISINCLMKPTSKRKIEFNAKGDEIMAIVRSDLTNDEFSFLVEHKIHWENLFDARGLPPSGWDDSAKKLGLDFGLSEPCYKGHRLRSRKGHCIQCRTAEIAFLRRNSANGYIYIAATKLGKLYKIGSTIDFKQRLKALRQTQYAGFDDWQIICVARIKNSGKIEFDIHRKLDDFKVARSYLNSGVETNATEVFETSLTNVWQAFQTSVDWKNLPENSKDRAKNFAAFDFKK